VDISRRKRRILQEIVSLYTLYGDPVGSKLLGELLGEISVSSATIRNDMADLTSMGYLEQPHTSAGRVPTVLGYRYYVDNLLKTSPLTEEERAYVDSLIEGMDPDPEKSAELAARCLVRLTGLAAIATTPRGGDIRITRFELLRCGKYNVAVIGITGIGGIRVRVSRVPAEVTPEQLEKICRILNENMIFVSAEDVTSQLLTSIHRRFGQDADIGSPILAAAAALTESMSEVRVFTDGQQQLLSFTELDESIRSLLELFSDSEALSRSLEISSAMRVFVGDAFGIDRLGMVIGRYSAAGGRYGALAAVGPVRMDYGFVIPRLSYLQDKMSAELTSPN